MQICNLLQVFLLKFYKANGRVKPSPLPVIENHAIPYEMESVLQHEVRGSCSHLVDFYLIKCLGHGLEDNF